VDRLERLLNLVVALLDTPRPLTRDELRERVSGYSEDDDNFRRNFERDKDLLREMGIPLVAEPLDPRAPEAGTGYRVPRQLYELPDPGLDEDELMALSLAASAVGFQGVAEGAAPTALSKLASSARAARTGGVPSATPGAPSSPTGEEPGPGLVVGVPADDNVALLFSGVSSCQVARFTYKALERRVDPYRLSYRQGHWYLSAFDHGRSSTRLFRVDRIDGPVHLEGTAGAFCRPASAPVGPPPPWQVGEDDETVVEVRVDPVQAAWACSAVGEEAVSERYADGGALLRMKVTNRRALLSFVLGLLDHAEVLSPPEVRSEVVSWLQALVPAGQAEP